MSDWTSVTLHQLWRHQYSGDSITKLLIFMSLLEQFSRSFYLSCKIIFYIGKWKQSLSKQTIKYLKVYNIRCTQKCICIGKLSYVDHPHCMIETWYHEMSLKHASKTWSWWWFWIRPQLDWETFRTQFCLCWYSQTRSRLNYISWPVRRNLPQLTKQEIFSSFLLLIFVCYSIKMQ